MDQLENYNRFRSGMILRDYLARDRTELANERTFLAYVRTALGFVATGAGLLKLFDSAAAACSGYALLAVSPLILIAGVVKYSRMRKRLAPLAAVPTEQGSAEKGA